MQELFESLTNKIFEHQNPDFTVFNADESPLIHHDLYARINDSYHEAHFTPYLAITSDKEASLRYKIFGNSSQTADALLAANRELPFAKEASRLFGNGDPKEIFDAYVQQLRKRDIRHVAFFYKGRFHLPEGDNYIILDDAEQWYIDHLRIPQSHRIDVRTLQKSVH